MSPDGSILAVGSWDGEVIVFWDIETLEPLLASQW